MPTVTVKYLPYLNHLTGNKTEIIRSEKDSIEAILDKVLKKHGEPLTREILDNETKRPFPFIKIFVNGRDIYFLNGLNTKIQDGDSIAILPPIGGG